MSIMRIAACAAALLALAAPASQAAPQPGDCQNDSKLIGPILLSTADEAGTWWRLTKDGFDAAGITDYKGAIEGFFGTTFATLDDAVAVLVDAVRGLDKNGNGYVCASSVRGTRAVLGDPLYANYYFLVVDDKHVK